MPRLLLGILLGLGIAQAGGPTGFVKGLDDAQVRTAPNGKARVHILASPAVGGTKNAFVGVLEIDGGGAVPEHADATEEYIYFLDGSGEITIDGKTHAVAPGDLIYMPARAKVSFQGGAEPIKVLQVFAGPQPASKYDAWSK